MFLKEETIRMIDGEKLLRDAKDVSDDFDGITELMKDIDMVNLPIELQLELNMVLKETLMTIEVKNRAFKKLNDVCRRAIVIDGINKQKKN